MTSKDFVFQRGFFVCERNVATVVEDIVKPHEILLNVVRGERLSILDRESVYSCF